MPREADFDYYVWRARVARQMADQATDEATASIHKRLAEMWSLMALSEQAMESRGSGPDVKANEGARRTA